MTYPPTKLVYIDLYSTETSNFGECILGHLGNLFNKEFHYTHFNSKQHHSGTFEYLINKNKIDCVQLTFIIFRNYRAKYQCI